MSLVNSVIQQLTSNYDLPVDQMNDVTLKRVEYSKHLGTILLSTPKEDLVTHDARLSVGRRSTYGFLSTGDKRTPVNPTSAANVYKQQALPRMLCGSEGSQLSSKSIKILGNGHWLPTNTQDSIETEIQLGQLMFFSENSAVKSRRYL